MVMTCSLMIYAALEHRIRKGHSCPRPQRAGHEEETDAEANRPLDLPVLWRDPRVQPGGEPAQVTDINTVQETIIDVLGPRYRQIYS